jgi:polar amino acid transport system substrate-binding protein
MRPVWKRQRLLVALALPALAVVACGGGSSSGSGGGSSPSAASATLDDHAAGTVPPAIKSKGTLMVAADATYAPMEFVQPGTNTVVGVDADLAQAIGQVLGLQMQVVNATFDTIIPGLTSGKYDLGMSSFTDTKSREQQVDFVTYFTAGTSFFVKASDGPNIRTLNDLCGHKVSVETGTTEQSDAQMQSTMCTQSGKAAVTVDVYPDQNSANLALSSGRDDVGMADSPVAAYQVKQSMGTFKLSGQSYGNAPYGIAIPKNNGMAQPILAAVKDLMSNGVYTSILKKWGVQEGAITNPQINGATS